MLMLEPKNYLLILLHLLIDKLQKNIWQLYSFLNDEHVEASIFVCKFA